MPYFAPKRRTILVPSGTTHDPGKKHLFVICTEPCVDGKQVIVSISTKTSDICDLTCILQSHEHSFLVAESFVFYRKARIEFTTALINGVERGVFYPKENMNGQTFLRILRGICGSPQTPPKVKVYIGCPNSVK